MPRQRSTAKGIPVDPEKCRTVRHLQGPEYKVYDVMYGYAFAARKSREGNDATGPLLFTAAIKPTLCNALALSPNQTYLMVARLEELAWVAKVAEGGRRDNGKKSPDSYLILDHGEFIKKHPNTCPDNPCPVSPDDREALLLMKEMSSDVDKERVSRFYKFNSPATVALADAIAALTEDDWQQVRLELGVTEEEWKRLKQPVPKRRDPRQSLSVGTGKDAQPVPIKRTRQSLSNGVAGPYQTDAPVPTHREESFSTSVRTSVNTPTHPDSRVGGVLREKPDHGESEVTALLAAFVKSNGGEAGQITAKQRGQLKELVERHGREKFRAAARAWMKASPWNNQTTHPFTGFISGFEGYAAQRAFQESESERLKKQGDDLALISKFHTRKALVGYGSLNKEFLDSLTQGDRDYIKQVADAQTLEAMPADNGRRYSEEEIEFRKVKTAEQEQFLKDLSSEQF